MGYSPGLRLEVPPRSQEARGWSPRLIGLVLFSSCSGLDDVIFSYVLGVLGDLGPSGPSEENFDMEAFTEMMEAYVPGHAHIPRWGRGWGPRQGAG